ncbi:hypothetical protein CFC21_036634, partial [Triticum aestivum]
MESRRGGGGGPAAAAGDPRGPMPGFGAPQHTIPTDVNIMQPSRVADFGALAHSAGFRIEDLANFSTNNLFNLKPNTHAYTSEPLQFGNYGKSISPTDLATTAAAAAAVTAVDPQALLQQKGAQPNLVALRTHNNDNWGESSMADTSPRTDTSTDPDIDIDERNQM